MFVMIVVKNGLLKKCVVFFGMMRVIVCVCCDVSECVVWLGM